MLRENRTAVFNNKNNNNKHECVYAFTQYVCRARARLLLKTELSFMSQQQETQGLGFQMERDQSKARTSERISERIESTTKL